LRRRLFNLAVVALAVVGLDQVLKALAQHLLAAGPVPVIPGFFDLVLVYNRGAAFGSFTWLPRANWVFLGVTLVAVGVALWLALGPSGRRAGVRVSLGLIVGGALGNMIDRLRLGQVVDFVYLYLGSWHWPAFNLADAAITVGGVYLAWMMIRGKA